jgi:hypothetical protein
VTAGVSAEERLDQGDEGCLVLEYEGVAGVGVERELGARDQAGESVAVGEGSSRSSVPLAMSVGRAILAGCVPAGSRPAHHWSIACPWAVRVAAGAAGTGG